VCPGAPGMVTSHPLSMREGRGLPVALILRAPLARNLFR
jgi:hypothetical protein